MQSTRPRCSTAIGTWIFLIAGSFLCVPIAAAENEARIWTDKSGKHEIRAKFVDIQKGIVRLERPNGNITRVPLTKLSKEDQAYLRELAKKKRDSAVTPQESAAPTGKPPKKAPRRPPKKTKKKELPPYIPPEMNPPVEAVIPSVSAVSRSAAVGTTLTPDPETDVGTWEPLTVRLSDKRAFFESMKEVKLEGLESPQVIVVHNGGSRPSDTRTRIERIVLSDGTTEDYESAPAKIEKFTVSPSGKRLLTICKQSGNWPPTQIDIWQMDDGKLQHELSWLPYDHEKKKQVKWLQWIDDDHLITRSDGSVMILWEVAEAKLLFEKKLDWSSEPAFSPGGAQFAVANSKGIDVYESRSFAQLAHFDAPCTWTSKVAFSPSGKYLAVSTGKFIELVDVTSGKHVSSIFHRKMSGAPGWLNDDYLLMSNGDVVDRKRGITVWRYENIGQQFGAQPLHRWIAKKSSDRQVVCFSLPVEPMQESAASLTQLSDDEVLALKPGTKVSIDISLMHRNLEPEVRTRIVKSLTDAGMVVEDGQPIKVIARMENGKREETTYQSFGLDRKETKVSYTPLIYRTILDINGEKVWESASTQTPGFHLRGKEGESVNQTVARLMQPNVHYFGTRIPSYVVKPQYQEPPGTTKLSVGG